MKHLDPLMKLHNNVTHEKYRNKIGEILTHPTAEQPGKLFQKAVGALRRIIRVGTHSPLVRQLG
jgi:hypothetical protein